MRYWTTVDRPVGEQFSYWREVICEAFTPLATEQRSAHRPPGPRQPGIESWVRSNPLTTTNCAEVVSATQLITHGEAEVRRTESDHVFVNLQLRGHCVGGQGGRTCIVRPGGFAMFDTTAEYRLEFVGEPTTQEWHVVSFRVPRAQLIPLLADPHGFTAVTHDAAAEGSAALVASTMMSIWKNVGSLDRAGTEAADTAFTALLGRGSWWWGPAARHLQERARRLVARLDQPLRGGEPPARRPVRSSCVAAFRHLSPQASPVVRGHGTGLAQTVMTLRVEACARELASGTRQSMTELASRWGFCDLSHLNKVFRSRYDCLPSQCRSPALPSGGLTGAGTVVR